MTATGSGAARGAGSRRLGSGYVAGQTNRHEHRPPGAGSAHPYTATDDSPRPSCSSTPCSAIYSEKRPTRVPYGTTSLPTSSPTTAATPSRPRSHPTPRPCHDESSTLSRRGCVPRADGLARDSEVDDRRSTSGRLEQAQRSVDDLSSPRPVADRPDGPAHQVRRDQGTRDPQLDRTVSEGTHEDADGGDPHRFQCSGDESDRPVAHRSGGDQEGHVDLAGRHVLGPARCDLLTQPAL
jgi:hypothetical protein